MELRVTVVEAGSSVERDVEITVDPATPVDEVLAALPVRTAGLTCYAGSQPLDRSASLAASPLMSGCHLGVGAPAPDVRGLPDPDAVGALRVIRGASPGAHVWLTPGAHLVGAGPRAALVVTPAGGVTVAPATGPDAAADGDAPGVPGVPDAEQGVDAATAPAAVTATALGPGIAADPAALLPGAPPPALAAPQTDDNPDDPEPNPASRPGDVPLLDGAPLEGRVPLQAGAHLTVGPLTVQWVPLPHQRLRADRAADGRLEFDRAFAATPAPPQRTVTLPEPVPDRPQGLAAMLASAGALALAGILGAALSRQPTMLLLALLSPLAVLVPHAVERRAHRRRLLRYTEEQQEARGRIADAVAADERARRACVPDQLDAVLAAAGLTRSLWSRRAGAPDALLLHLGTTDAPASIVWDGRPWPGLRTPFARDVPLTLDLASTGVLGIVGQRHERDGLGRWVLLQLAVHRSPDDLRLVLLADSDGASLAWARWLPHLGAIPGCVGTTPESRQAIVTQLRDLVRRRQGDRALGRSGGEDVVVVLDGGLALRRLPGMDVVLREGPAVGVRSIVLDERDAIECDAVAAISGGRLQLTATRSGTPIAGTAATLPVAVAERAARALAPMRDRLTLAGDATSVPERVRLLDLLGIEGAPGVDDVLAAWAATPGPVTRVPIGADGAGAVHVDLARQGPHVMLGGTTGAGKSVLLQTLVTSLLLANSPEELQFVLVDFKGGAAFAPFERCPHVAALIRSTGHGAHAFDEAAAQRVLDSLAAEVRRREALLERHEDLDRYWRARRGDPSLPPLPRLVLVLDEFARVLEVTPGFITELVRVASKGRSLGMHLVLSTQSLQGKLPPELRANVDLRISLRQIEPADSVEVLGTRDAADIPGHLTGRGLVLSPKAGMRTPQPFQTGYLGDPPPGEIAIPTRVRPLPWSAFAEPPAPAPPGPPPAATDLHLAVGAVTAAARRLGRPAPAPPLYPPLPDTLPLATLDTAASVPCARGIAAFALQDAPAEQQQLPLGLDLTGTRRLLVAGGPQSGRTTAARALVTALAARFSPREAHAYVIERRHGGLDRLSDLPHCGAVIPAGDGERVRRLVRWLDAEVRRRGAAAADAARGGTRTPGDAAEATGAEATGADGTDPTNGVGAADAVRPAIVLVVDGWEALEDRSDPAWVETTVVRALRRVVADGPSVGVHVVPIGGQALATSRMADLFDVRLLLPFPSADIRRQLVRGGVAMPPPLPGRAVDAGSGRAVQVCLADPAADRGLEAEGPSSPAGLPRRFPPLPTAVTLDAVPPAPGSTWLPLGVGGDDVAPVGVDLFDGDTSSLLVAGGPGTGRSTAAGMVAAGLARRGVAVLVLAPPRSPVAGLLAGHLPPGDEAVEVLASAEITDDALRAAAAALLQRTGRSRLALVVDDFSDVTVTPGTADFMERPTLLVDCSAPAARGRRGLVLCGDATPVLEGRRRSLSAVLAEVVSSGARLLLAPPSPMAGRELRLTLEPDECGPAPPGRGHLATGTAQLLVQLAAPPPSPVRRSDQRRPEREVSRPQASGTTGTRSRPRRPGS